jgi:hypothetical protein
MNAFYSPRGARRGALLGLLVLASWLAWASWYVQGHSAGMTMSKLDTQKRQDSIAHLLSASSGTSLPLTSQNL